MTKWTRKAIYWQLITVLVYGLGTVSAFAMIYGFVSLFFKLLK